MTDAARRQDDGARRAPAVEYRGVRVEVRAGETVLAALERARVPPPRGCRRGACGACRLRVVDGGVASDARRSLRAVHAASGAILACVTRPRGDLVLEDFARGHERRARVVAREPLAGGVERVRLALDEPLAYAPGQHVVLTVAGREHRAALASLPREATLELHVECDAAPIGARVTLRGPLGACWYRPGAPEQPLVLAGTGTGLAAVVGVLRDALDRGHTGPIALYHGACSREGLYLDGELDALAAATPNLRYERCVPDADLGAVVLRDLGGSASGHRAYLAGHGGLVRALARRLYVAGAAPRDLCAEPFEPSAASARSMARAT